VRVLFWGTPEFATAPLRALLGEGFEVVAVVTQPDKPVGRSRSTLRASAVKQVSVAEGIPVLQPEKPKGEEFLAQLRELAPDVSVVVRFKRDNDEGHAEVHKKLGLTQLSATNAMPSYSEGTQRGKSIGVRRGPADEVEFASVMKWSDATADVSLEVRETDPGDKRSAIESYRRPGAE
jgi:hypothetical protein